ncbi:MAG: rhomboid family intramembrane serine protease, partial [Pseudomonadota bacterium]
MRTLILATCAGFALELVAGDAVLALFALWPLQAGFLPWQVFSYALLHASASHLAFNMLGLWMFGRALQDALGGGALLALYVAGVLSAAVTQLLVSSFSAEVYPTVGASGGVFGLLLAYGVCFPRRIIILLIPPIPLPAWLAVILYAGVELVMGVSGTEAKVAHFAHLGG